MRYCKKCGNRLDDFDSYCGNCGAKVENDTYSQSNTDRENYGDKQDKRTSIEDSINNFTEAASKNFDALICFVCGILSVTCGTFICAIVSLVFASRAKAKGQDSDPTGATFCKVGTICSKVSIALSVLSAIVFIVLAVVFWI